MDRRPFVGERLLVAALMVTAFPALVQDATASPEASSSWMASDKATYSLVFDPQPYTVKTTTVDDQTIRYRAFKGIVYVSDPVDSGDESMDLFVPEDYYEGKVIGGYSVDSAPIFFTNAVGGYMPTEPSESDIESNPSSGMSVGLIAGAFANTTISPVDVVSGASPAVPGGFCGLGPGPNVISVALAKGYVVASPGCRGIIQNDVLCMDDALACIVDLKAAVRYLRYNDAVMPGDAEKIISNGTSIGGAISAILGVTGNSKDYEPYLKALGAADARDNVFAASCHCPTSGLDDVDMAYGWQLNGIDDYCSMVDVDATSTGQIAALALLKTLFPASSSDPDLQAVCTTIARYWHIRRSGDYDKEELFAWIAQICS